MDRNRTRSRSGTRSLAAVSRTRRLKSSHESSLLRNRFGERSSLLAPDMSVTEEDMKTSGANAPLPRLYIMDAAA